jgi:hypothetical protein
MTSVDFLQGESFITAAHALIRAPCKTSRDKHYCFQQVLLDLPETVTVGFGAFRNPLLSHPPFVGLLSGFCGQYAVFADGFFQICCRPQHPCHLLTLPSNSACTGTCILPVVMDTQHTINPAGTTHVPAG